MKKANFSLSLFYLAFINLVFSWKEWINEDVTTPPTQINSRLYSAGFSFVSWTQKDADSLCPNDECGPYCNYTSTTCNSTNEAYLATFPSPSGTTDADTSCPDFCCSVENCLRTRNMNGYDIGIEKEYVLTFGGRQVSAATDTTLLEDKCEIDSLQVYNDGSSCLGTVMDDISLIDIEGNKMITITPVINPEVTVIGGRTSPSGRYGHKIVYISRTQIDPITGYKYFRKYVYMYGGYSPDCGGYCSDLWRYEIPWAPQRYYPEGSGYWNRGNHWEQVVTPTGPGNRAWFSMSSDGRENIYLFGGVMQNADGTKVYTNDLWKFSVSTTNWTQIRVKKIVSAIRTVRLWDGSWANIDGDINQMNNQDIKSVQELPLIPCVIDSQTPPCRGFSSLSYDNVKNWLILTGGYDSNSTSKEVYMSHIWTFDLTPDFPVWTQFDKGSDQTLTPGGPAFASSTYISTSDYRFQFYFGGVISNYQTRDGLWAYNFNLSKSTQMNPQPLSSTQSYPRMTKGMTLIALTKNKGLFLFGGYLRNTLTQLMNQSKTTYLEECLTNITTAGFKLSDSLDPAWQQYYILSGNTCFDPTRVQFYRIEHQFTISDKMWMYMQSYCRVDNPSYGVCFWGRANCASNRYGADCSNLQCINSLCYQEKTSLTEAVCIHCYARGECVNGQCICDEGHTYDDCSGVDCPNNCSNTATSQVATCIMRYPLSVCQCYRETKRGGDDCSYIFCLNDCGGHGTCVEGECQCDSNYHGLDCSIFDIDFISDTDSTSGNLLKLSLISLFIFINVIFL